MRPKVDEKAKRGTIIGIKADKTTKAQIDYIAKYHGLPTSTYIFNLITKDIKEFTYIQKTNWKEEIKEEK